MALTAKSESFTSATIDVEDMTITEFTDDNTRTYSLLELFRRWDGIPDITLTIHRRVPLPQDGREYI